MIAAQSRGMRLILEKLPLWMPADADAADDDLRFEFLSPGTESLRCLVRTVRDALILP